MFGNRHNKKLTQGLDWVTNRITFDILEIIGQQGGQRRKDKNINKNNNRILCWNLTTSVFIR